MRTDDLLAALRTRIALAIKNIDEAVVMYMLHDSAVLNAAADTLRRCNSLVVELQTGEAQPLPRRTPPAALVQVPLEITHPECWWPDEHDDDCHCARAWGIPPQSPGAIA